MAATDFLLVLFWLSVAVIAFVYVGYPTFLAVLALVWNRTPRKASFQPTVSILIAAHNEESHIGETLANKLALDYPRELVEIIVVSDASTDSTNDIVRGFEDHGVRLIVQPERGGKTVALNVATKFATGEVLVFSDANSIYEADAVSKLVRNFADPKIGYVTGKMVYVDESGSLVGSGCSWFMRYENLLRRLETRVGSVIGVDGGIDAVRSRLYQPMDPEMLPDFVLPLRVIASGHRVVYESEALLKESALSHVSDEWQMRVRVTLRAFHALWKMKVLFNPFMFGFVSFQLLCHKLLRYWVGLFQIVAFTANALLVAYHPLYTLLFALQILFYSVAIAGILRNGLSEKLAFVKYPSYLCLVNGAAIVAFWRFLRSENQVTWNPRKG